jgi:NAD(P)-dependent dehydrogenase (short-subunit alcohol dehydrogenase family)
MIDFKALQKLNDLDLKVVITGANSGIGYEAMRFLAVRGAHIIFGARSLAKADEAMAKIEAVYKRPKIEFVPLDLGDNDSIFAFVKKVRDTFDSIDILINNAGIMALPYGKTKQGFEQQMGINHLGHFILTHQLKDHLSQKARIINVSSQASLPGKIQWDDIFYEKGGYTPFKSYAQSKLANVLFSEGLVEYFKGSSVKVLTVHPGLASTGLFNRKESSRGFKVIFKLLAPFASSAEKGARPTIAAALAEEVNSGDFLGPKVKGNPHFISQNEKKNAIALNPSNVTKFFNWSETVTGLSFRD